MTDEPHQIKDARKAIATLLGRLQPTPSAEWIEERTNQLMRQFDEHPTDDPPIECPG